MPNWCSNNLIISGEKAAILRFLEGLKALPATYTEEEAITEPCYTLNSYVPVPAEIQAKPYSPDYSHPQGVPPMEQECGYYWQSREWGSKWDCFGTSEFEAEMRSAFSELEAQPNEGILAISLVFDSAWSPICPWVIKVGPLFPELSFELHYIEESMSFGGVLFVEGDHADDRYYDDARLYQLVEDRGSLSDLMEDFYYVAIEYSLEEESLKKLPDELEEEAMQAWESAVVEIIEGEVDDYFSGIIKGGYARRDQIIGLALDKVKSQLAS